mgnify:FL=1
MSKPVNKYLKQHHSKYYYQPTSENINNQQGSTQQKSVKKKLSKQASPDSYDFTIGRTKNVKTDASVVAEQLDQGFDDFDQVRYCTLM